MSTVINTAPASEPVSISEFKDHSTIEITDDDALVDGFITAARVILENDTKRAFVTQTWDYYLYGFCDVMILPFGKIQSVSAITYTDENGATQTLSASVYTVDTYRDPGRVVLAYDQAWPSTRDEINAVKITYVAGYGAASSVPQPIKTAVSLFASHLYENREAVTMGSLSEIPLGVESIISPYRIKTF